MNDWSTNEVNKTRVKTFATMTIYDLDRQVNDFLKKTTVIRKVNDIKFYVENDVKYATIIYEVYCCD